MRLETFQLLPSAKLIRRWSMGILAFLPIRMGNRALVVYSGYLLGWSVVQHKWEIMVDLFFYREPEVAKELEEEEALAPDYAMLQLRVVLPQQPITGMVNVVLLMNLLLFHHLLEPIGVMLQPLRLMVFGMQPPPLQPLLLWHPFLTGSIRVSSSSFTIPGGRHALHHAGLAESSRHIESHMLQVLQQQLLLSKPKSLQELFSETWSTIRQVCRYE